MVFIVSILSQNTWDDQLLKKQRVGLWGGGSVVKSLTVLPDNLDSIPITHFRFLTMACPSSACCPMMSCGLVGTFTYGAHTHTDSHTATGRSTPDEGAFVCCCCRYWSAVRWYLASGPVAECFNVVGTLMTRAIHGLEAEKQGNARRETGS